MRLALEGSCSRGHRSICQGSTSASNGLLGLTAATHGQCWQDVGVGSCFCFGFDFCYSCTS